jgi:hypothetical protein
MRLTVSPGGVPIGSYNALFTGIEPTTNDFGEGLKWWFQVTSGPCAGGKIGRITAMKPTLRNSCGKMLSGVVGRPLANDMEVDLAAFVGRMYLIIVAEGKSGGTYVDAVTQPPMPTPSV